MHVYYTPLRVSHTHTLAAMSTQTTPPVAVDSMQQRMRAAEKRVNDQRQRDAKKFARSSYEKLAPGDVPRAMKQHMKRSCYVTDDDVQQDRSTRELLYLSLIHI